MMLTRPKLREIDLQRQVVQLAELLGWEHVHWRPAMTKQGWRTPGSGTLAKGFPDLLLVRPSDRRLIFVELKADGHKPTPDQERVLDVLRSVSEIHVWSPAMWDDIEATLR
ncbi:MAG: VRR-NUC domain-containing protein [Chloroflexi bacterium]|nr:VRR-NUC domain-containing protein [Chloroflexota bacterium]